MKTRWMSVIMASCLAASGVARASGQSGETSEPATGVAVGSADAARPAESRQRSESNVDPAEMAADALVVRPAGLAATAIGAAIFVVALPFAAIAGDVKGAGRTLVGAPARFTFKRKLGVFESTNF